MDERELFLKAREISDAEDRDRFLNEACDGQPELLGRVVSLLNAYADPGDFLEDPHPSAGILAHAHRNESIESPGAVIANRYRLTERLGEGGMGSVWRAEQFDPVHRQVAIKLIRSDREGSKSILQRFSTERQAIAMMDHPNVARLLDAGTSQGRPYFVMELVNGPSLTEFCDRERLPIAERLRLFIQVCAAVQHAHHKGIIHRDLKPSNILVETVDGKFVPRIIDFGVAKAVGGWRLSETMIDSTLPGVAGTPLYMAPEQAAWQEIDVDTRADVYSLGVVLYELLTGTTPLERSLFGNYVYEAVFQAIRNVDPPAPSKRLTSTTTKVKVAEDRQTNVFHLARSVRGDLDWIVMKALAKERERRYETPSAFAEDLQRYLRQEPVEAGPPGALYRCRKLLIRHSRAAITAGLFVILLVGGTISTALGLLEARSKSRMAEQAMLKAREHALTATQQEELAKKHLALSEESRAEAGRHLQALKESRRRLFISHGFNAMRNYDPLEALSWYTSAMQGVEVPSEIDTLRIAFCESLCPRVTSIYWGSGRSITPLNDCYSRRLSKDGEHFVTSDGIVDASSGVLAYRWEPNHYYLGASLTDKRRVVAVRHAGSIDLVRLDSRWSPQQRISLVSSTGIGSTDAAIQFSADGETVLVRKGVNRYSEESLRYQRGADELQLLTIEGEEVWRLSLTGEDGTVRSYGLSGDSSRLFIMTSKDQKKTGLVYSVVASKQPSLIKKVVDVAAASMSPDSNQLAVLNRDGRLEIHSLTSDQVEVCGGVSMNAYRGIVEWSPDGKRIITGSESSECVSVMVNGSGATLKLSSNPLKTSDLPWSNPPIVFSADGTSMALLHKDGTCSVWKDGRRQFATLRLPELIDHIDVSSDGRRVLTSSREQTKVWELPERPTWILRGDKDAEVADTREREKRLKMQSSSGTVTGIQDLRVPELRSVHGLSLGAKFTVAGEFAVFPGRDASRALVAAPFPKSGCYLWDPSTGSVFSSPVMQSAMIYDADFHPEGRLLVTDSLSRQNRDQWSPAGVTIWDCELGFPLWAANAANLERSLWSGTPRFSKDGLSITAKIREKTDVVKVTIDLPPFVDFDVARSIALAGTEMTISESGLVQPDDQQAVRKAWQQLQSIRRASSSERD